MTGPSTTVTVLLQSLMVLLVSKFFIVLGSSYFKLSYKKLNLCILY